MLALLATLALCSALVAASGPAPDFKLERVGEGVWAAIGTDGGKAGANAGFVVGEDGVAVIDTFADPEAAKELLAEIRKLTPLPIRFVVNTHYHLDHVNGNDVFAAAGATILAQRNVRDWERTENLKWWGDKIKPEVKARVESLKLPDVVYDQGVDLYLDSRKLEVRSYPGHTGGDSIVYVHDAGVLFCGDLFWNHHIPNLTDATTGVWTKTLNALVGSGAGKFVPGHGEPGTSLDVRALQQYLEDLRAAVGLARAAGKSGDALVEAVLPELQTKYGSWGFFKEFAKANIKQTGEELAGSKRVPHPAGSAASAKPSAPYLPLRVQVGEKAPDFTLPSADGQLVKLSSLEGQNVLLDFYEGFW
ncbi:MAG TPA: MBL fold metallo-hydrolase [Terriglobales bacterium]|nr:MBL fold metallo-hydrolase [Terriglobales bacterium]